MKRGIIIITTDTTQQYNSKCRNSFINCDIDLYILVAIAARAIGLRKCGSVEVWKCGSVEVWKYLSPSQTYSSQPN